MTKKFKHKKNRFEFNKRVVVIGTCIISALILIGLFTFTNLAFLFTPDGSKNNFQPLEFGELLGFDDEKEIPWWNSDYGYSKSVDIFNVSPFESLEKDSVIEFEFNHKELVDNKKSSPDGSDIVILSYDDSTESFTVLSTELVNAGSENARMKFKLPYEIEALGNNKDIYFYYGNLTIAESDVKGIFTTLLGTNFEYEVQLSVESKNPVFGSTNRLWILKGADDFPDYSELVYKVDVKEGTDPISDPTYEIMPGNIKGTLEKQSFSNEYEAKIDVTEIPAGNYSIQTTLTNLNGIEQKSQTSHFIVSAPLYVAWTIDWEGYDTDNSTLKAMEDFSAKYSTPMVHFWNPRTNIAISKDRNEYLLNWIKDRETKGDEVGMHLHMHYDLVRAAGVEPYYDPQWANRNTGSDVPMYAYSYEDQVKLLAWGKNEFIKSGLSLPKSFRGGGWMIDEDTIKALETTGFLVDSSGRTKFSFGQYKVSDVIEPKTEELEPTVTQILDEISPTPTPEEKKILRDPTPEEIALYENYIEDRDYLIGKTNPDGTPLTLPNFVSYKVDGKWDLLSTTLPYQPSLNDINKTGVDKSTVWEFPNNGVDSWHFDQKELIKRFNDNYKDKPIDEAQILVYLTHPHSINVDIPRLDATYTLIDKFNIEDDNGPVIYVTFEEAYNDLTGGSYN